MTTPDDAPTTSHPAASRDDEPLGGESPCWMHLLDDDGRMPDHTPDGPGAADRLGAA
jgi:hypothetical protein